MPTYASVTDLQAAPNMSAVPQPECERLLAIAEDLIDRWLGLVPVSADTGRKLDPAVLTGWQTDRLSAVTVTLAARVYSQPQALSGPRWTREKGPDFEVDGPVTAGAAALLGEDLTASLLSLGLHRRLGRAVI